ncbi:hypothetical protein AVEN_109269-1 [Araneus ventricosus]|uniref:Uncharacterized protein n=1 Tax=Araneus ventricosus TaxID=182803 RepID=A0A4Y2TAG0_ARAVE|nr:hypothetical protein AVEN_109269-1 [Araneus ventricosus]
MDVILNRHQMTSHSASHVKYSGTSLRGHPCLGITHLNGCFRSIRNFRSIHVITATQIPLSGRVSRPLNFNEVHTFRLSDFGSFNNRNGSKEKLKIHTLKDSTGKWNEINHSFSSVKRKVISGLYRVWAFKSSSVTFRC